MCWAHHPSLANFLLRPNSARVARQGSSPWPWCVNRSASSPLPGALEAFVSKAFFCGESSRDRTDGNNDKPLNGDRRVAATVHRKFRPMPGGEAAGRIARLL